MFKALKRRFILIYTLSIFLLVLFSFSLIFYSSYSNIQQETKMRLKQRDDKINHNKDPNQIDNLEDPYSDSSDLKPNIWDDPNLENEEKGVAIFGDDIYILLDENLDELLVAGQGEIDDDDIKTIKEQIIEQKKKLIAVDDNFYVYTMYSISQGQVLKLLDVTNSIRILKNLLVTLIVIGLIINIIAIIIGNIFATKALKPIKESYDRQKVFVSDASHEIKTPISVISTCLDLIKEGDDESDKWLDYCIDETARLKKLTANLLTLSKANIKVSTKDLKKINISEQLEMLICVYEVSLFEDNFKLETNILENIQIPFLEDDFKQLFHILIDNAIKYNTSDKLIKVSLKKEEKYAVMKIINSSEKIKNSEIEKIFDRFYRQDKVRNKQIEGFGLGLSLATQILNAYSAKQKVKYEDGNFIFEVKFLLN